MQVFLLNVIILCYVRAPIFQKDRYHGNTDGDLGLHHHVTNLHLGDTARFLGIFK